MNFVRITRSTDPILPSLIQLLSREFEEHQLRPTKQLKEVIDTQPNHYFTAIQFNGRIAGVIVYWHLLKQFYYIEHFAILPEFRGEHIGQKVIDHINHTIGGIWLLELDPIGDAVHERLRKWYERNLFKVVTKQYDQPPYVVGEATTPLWIMTNKPVTEEQIQLYLATMKQHVYEVAYHITRV